MVRLVLMFWFMFMWLYRMVVVLLWVMLMKVSGCLVGLEFGLVLVFWVRVGMLGRRVRLIVLLIVVVMKVWWDRLVLSMWLMCWGLSMLVFLGEFGCGCVDGGVDVGVGVVVVEIVGYGGVDLGVVGFVVVFE